MIETGDKIYAIIWTVIILVALLGRSKAEYLKGAKTAFIWFVIIMAVFTAYTYWQDFKGSKFYTALVPGSALIKEDGTMEFTRAEDEHFHILAKVNGVNVRFLVDTGAADISLTQQDAKRIGFNLNDLKYNKLYSTANGTTRGASVKLKNIEIGDYQTGEFYASVNEGELRTSLLGMSFLNRMKSYKVEGDKLILQP